MSKQFFKDYFKFMQEGMVSVHYEDLKKTVEKIQIMSKNGNKLIIAGNGGSAATASHFANDIAIGTRSWNKPFKAISLLDNNAVVSAISNDDGYDKVFVQQLMILLKENDLVVAISASGNSANIIEAINYANDKRAKTIGLTGFDGGELRKVVEHCIHVPTEKGEYGPVEDVHMILDHVIGSYLNRFINSIE